MGILKDVASFLKLGIVGSNSLAALGAYLAAAGGAGRGGAAAGPLPGPALLVLGGTALVVAGACALNNWLDRDLDARMARTRERPTARGSIGAPLALGLGAGLCLGGLLLLLGLGRLPALLGLLGGILYLGPYTLWAKRRGPWSALVGGLSGAVPPLIGWTGGGGGLSWGALSLFLLLLTWQQAHVRALAQARAAEYREAGLPLPGLGPGRPRRQVLAWLGGLVLVSGATAWSLGRVAWGLSSGLGLACLAVGLLAPDRGWPRLLFRLTLAWLVLLLGGLAASGLCLGA